MTGVIAAAFVALAIVPLGNDSARAGGAGSPAALVEVEGGKLTGVGEEAGGRLGSSMALSADGSTLIVGAQRDGDGAVYVYTRNGSKWEQQGPKLTGGEAVGGGEGTSEECSEETPEPGEAADECSFGTSVALSADGNTALVGDPSAGAAPGAVLVFTRTGGTWTHAATLVGGEPQDEGRFGRSVALSADGNTALVGDPSGLHERGAAWVFVDEGATWTREPALKDEEASVLAHFGRSVALSADGTTALIGGPGDSNYTGAAWTFTQSGGVWEQRPGKLVGEGAAVDTHFGKTVALSGDGSTALVGAQDAEGERGAAWAFERTATGFAEQGAELKAHEGEGTSVPESEGRFGASVAISANGNRALIGAPHDRQGVGRVTQLTRSGGVWSRAPEGLAGSVASARSWTGTSVALSGDGTVAAIGASHNGKQNGAAWVFEERPTVPPPVVLSVTPRRGTTAGGTKVTIGGENFQEAREVHFGKTAVAVTPSEDTTATITVLSPPGTPEKVHVTVTTATGVSEEQSPNNEFVYEEPETTGGGGGKSKENELETTPEQPGKTPSAPAKTSVATGGVQAFIASAGDCSVSVAKKRLAVTRYRSVALRLVRTGAGPCSGSVAISYRIKGAGRGRYTLRTIGTASFSIAPGTSRVVTVKLSKAGQKWLRLHKGKGNASLAIARVVPAPTLAHSASVRLSLKKARKQRASKR